MGNINLNFNYLKKMQAPLFGFDDANGKCMATYIWIGGSGNDLRCKDKVLDKVPKSVADLPNWNYDGSSTGQATTSSSEIIIEPRYMCRDPFRQGKSGDHFLVMCETFNVDGTPAAGNFRYLAEKVF